MYFSTLIANGVLPNPSTNVQVLVNEETSMTVTIMPGYAWINGYMYWNQVNLVKTLEPAYANPRIDRVVIRWSSNTREIKVYVLTGIPATIPTAPELTRNSDIWELGIADVYINGGATSITQSAINDLRLSNDFCGIVHALVDQVDTTTLFAQFQTWYSDTKSTAETDISVMLSVFQNNFATWFESVQGILNNDAAGNLLNLINNHEANTNLHVTSEKQATWNQYATKIAENTEKIDINADKITTGTITTSWTGTAVPYTKTITNSDVTATNTVEISLSPTATEVETLAWDDLNLKGGGQAAGSFTLRCWGTPNMINIPVVINVRGT